MQLPKVVRVLAVATSASFVLIGANVANAGACDNAIGDWSWFIGGKVAFLSGGAVRWTPPVTSIPPASGTWTCSPDGTLKVTWQNGFIDTLKASSDGNRLEGVSSTGATVSGVRASVASSSTTGASSGTTTGTSTTTVPQVQTNSGWTPIGNAGMGKQSTVPIGPNGPQRIGPQGRPPPKGAG